MNHTVIWQSRLQKIIYFILFLTLALSLVAIFKDKYNNYRIFHQSFFSLIQNLNLYDLHPDQHFDYYKYSPTFALFMAPLAALPYQLSGVLWNFLNVGLLIYAVSKINIDHKAKFFSLLIILPELIGTVQNFQSNALIVALMLLSYLALESDKYFKAAIYIALAIHIKFFAVVFLLMALLYAKPFRFIFWSLFLSGALIFLPGFIIGFDQLQFLYQEWGLLLKRDADSSHRLSIFGIVEHLAGVQLKPTLYQLFAGIILAIPFGLSFLQRFKFTKWLRLSSADRLYYLCILLMWLIVFNHMSESPTYIIGMIGFVIWYTALFQSTRKPWILWFTLLMSSFFYSDAVTGSLKANVVDHYVFKVWPFILIYFYGQWQIYQNWLQKPDSAS